MGRQNIGNILQTVNTFFALELYFQILSNQLLLSRWIFTIMAIGTSQVFSF